MYSIEAAKAFEAGILKEDSGRTRAAMENAGMAIGRALHADYREIREWPEDAAVLVLAGKGLNTGDAFVACRLLAERVPGLRITVVQASPPEELNPLAAAALEELKAVVKIPLQLAGIRETPGAPAGPVDVVLDGLYGMGFSPPLREEPAALIRRVNERSDIALRAAIDLPSGVGEKTDPGSFVADFTYIPGVAKEPCFRPDNARFTGRLRFLEIDPFRDRAAPDGQTVFVASPVAHRSACRLRPARSDKRSFGHCLILAGSKTMPGASLMAATAAARSGAGLVTCLSQAAVSLNLASALPEAMWQPLPDKADREIDLEVIHIVARLAEKAHGLLIGPGLRIDRASVFALSRIVRETPLPLVLDASALTQDIMAAILGRTQSAGPVLVTPHRGEYARILGPHEDPEDPETLMEFARKFRLTILLKGNPTLVTDGERLVHVPSGGPVLARGGSGDILAGMALVQLAQDPDHPLEAAIRAVAWHGAAADALARERGATAVRTSELLDYLAPSLRA